MVLLLLLLLLPTTTTTTTTSTTTTSTTTISLLYLYISLLLSGRKLLSLLSDFRQSTIHQLEETGGKATVGSSGSSSSGGGGGGSSSGSGGGGSSSSSSGGTFIDSPTMIQLSWTIVYCYNSRGRMLCKALNNDGDDDDDDDDNGEEKDNRIVDVHNALQAIHTAAIHGHDHHHHHMKMNDVKKLESALGDIVLQVFFFGIISDEVDTEV